MIPKIIHFVWVGTAPKSDLILQCIESWKKYCPDYKIKEWGNDDVAKIDNIYVKEAFKCKKWAFVSDYLRLYALATMGGFYFDSDLEITAPIDEFRKHSFVTCYENWEEYISPITSAFIGAEKGNKLVSDLLHEYNNLHFIVKGQMDQTTNVNRITKFFENNFGLMPPYNGDKTTILDKNHYIYPYFYFCKPKDGESNYAIHHCCGSWLDAFERKIKVKIGKYSIDRFRKIRNVGSMPLASDEKIVARVKTYKNCFYAIVKRKTA